MPFIEVDDVVFQELCEAFPDSFERRSVVTAHLSKLIPSQTKSIKTKKKNTTVRLSDEYKDFLAETSQRLNLNRMDILVGMLQEIDLNKLGFHPDNLKNYSRRSSLSSKGSYGISFNPPTHVHDRWDAMSESANMSKQLLLEKVIEYFMKVGYPQQLA